jgi:hypothetical protein
LLAVVEAAVHLLVHLVVVAVARVDSVPLLVYL